MIGAELKDLFSSLAPHTGANPLRRLVERSFVADWQLKHILENPEQDFQDGVYFVVGENVLPTVSNATSRNKDSCDGLRWSTLALDNRIIVEKSEFTRGSLRQGGASSDKVDVYRARCVEKLDKMMAFGVVKMGRFQERWVVHLDSPIALDKPDRVIFRLVGRNASCGKYQRIEQIFGSKGIVAALEKNSMPEEMSDKQECQLEGMIQLWPSVYYICLAARQREAIPQAHVPVRSMQASHQGHSMDGLSQRSSALNVQGRVPAVTSDPFALPCHIREPGTPRTPPNVGKGAVSSQRSSDMGTSPANEGLNVSEETEANKSATSYSSDEPWTDMMELVTQQPKQEKRKEAVAETPLCEPIAQLLKSVDVCDMLRALSSQFGWRVIQEAFATTEYRKRQSSKEPRKETTPRVHSPEETVIAQEASLIPSEHADVTPVESTILKAEGSEHARRRDAVHGIPPILPVKLVPRSRSQKEEMEMPGTFSIETICRMAKEAIDNGEKPRIVALAHEKTEGVITEEAFNAHGVPAKHFFRGKLKESNYAVQTRTYIVLVLNAHAVLNTGSEFLSTITAVCEPVDITSSLELEKLRQLCQEQSKMRNIKWYKMVRGV